MAAGGRIARRRAKVDVADRLAAASCLRLVARVVCRRLWFVVLSAAAGGAGAYAAVALRAPSELFSPHADRAIATTALTCGLLTLTIIAAYAWVTDRVRSEAQVTERHGIPCLARAPGLERRAHDPRRDDEEFRPLCGRLRRMLPVMGCGRVVGVSSALRDEDKTGAAISIARALAETGGRILLVEFDPYQPRMARMLGLENAPGLADVLARRADPDASIQRARVRGDLFVVTAGSAAMPLTSLTARRMELLLKAYDVYFDYIVLALPPVALLPEEMALNRMLDGLVLTVRRASTRHSALVDAMGYLDAMRVSVLGFVLT